MYEARGLESYNRPAHAHICLFNFMSFKFTTYIIYIGVLSKPTLTYISFVVHKLPISLSRCQDIVDEMRIRHSSASALWMSLGAFSTQIYSVRGMACVSFMASFKIKSDWDPRSN